MKDHISTGEDDVQADSLAAHEPLKTKTNFLGLWIFLGITAIASFGYYQSMRMKGNTPSNKAATTAPVASTSPNAIILTINGARIPRKLFSLSINNILQLAESQKLDVNAQEVQDQIRSLALANVINTQLLAQKAKSEGATVDTAKVDDSMRTIIEKAGNETKLDMSLLQLGMSRDELRDAIGNELLANGYIDKAIDQNRFAVSDEELKKYYNDQKTKLGPKAKVPAYADIKARLKDELIGQKRQLMIRAYLEDLRKNAKIDIVGSETK